MSFISECDRFFKDMFTDIGKAFQWLFGMIIGIVAVLFIVVVRVFYFILPLLIIAFFISLLI